MEDVEDMEVCIICKHGLEQPEDIHVARTRYSKTLLAVKIAKIIQRPMRRDDDGDQEETVDRICISCFELLNQIDQCEIQLFAFENEVKLKYKMPFPIEVRSRGAAAPPERAPQRPAAGGGDSAPHTQPATPAAPAAAAAGGGGGSHDSTMTADEDGEEEPSAAAAAPAPKSEPLQLAGGALGAEQICQVLSAAGLDPDAGYSIEVVENDESRELAAELAGESIIMYESGSSGQPNLARVLIADSPYSMQLADADGSGPLLVSRGPTAAAARRRARTYSRWRSRMGYFCHQCDETFANYNELAAHRERHRAETTFTCRYCGHQARTNMRLHAHQQQQHRDLMLPCPQCDKMFPEKSNLTRHLQIHAERKFVCEICSRGFHSKGDLGKHMVFRHSCERNFTCPECDDRFKTSWMMKRHIARVHARL